MEDLRFSFDGGPELQVREGMEIRLRLAKGHHVMVGYVPYFLPPKCGLVRRHFDVGEHPIHITYRAPWITFLEGTIEIHS